MRVPVWGYSLEVPLVNFFGHALLAARRFPERRDEPMFVLGSMLPDFASMAGVRIAEVHDPALAQGVALHHATDERFHAAPAFCELCRWANDELAREGVGRATARAVGHVGSELLLDGLLSHDRAMREVYGRTLEQSALESFDSLITLRGDVPVSQLSVLLTRLSSAPVPEGYRDPAFVLARLRTILEPRPRLALKPSDLEPTLKWLTKARDHLETNGTAWVDGLI